MGLMTDSDNGRKESINEVARRGSGIGSSDGCAAAAWSFGVGLDISSCGFFYSSTGLLPLAMTAHTKNDKITLRKNSRCEMVFSMRIQGVL